jgi:hypothetical protein
MIKSFFHVNYYYTTIPRQKVAHDTQFVQMESTMMTSNQGVNIVNQQNNVNPHEE